jgi:hypothetical protein
MTTLRFRRGLNAAIGLIALVIAYVWGGEPLGAWFAAIGIPLALVLLAFVLLRAAILSR